MTDYMKKLMSYCQSALKWCSFGILTGVVTGFVASVFAKLILYVSDFRMEHPLIILFLPVAGLFIAFLYRLAGDSIAGGTDLVIKNIQNGDKMPVRLAPVIFIATVITHLFGGSVGREGAALQLGSSMGSSLGRLLHFKDHDERRVIMCGMSGAFSALFGTPLAAMILPVEISTVGNMYYSALVPCALSSLFANHIARAMGLSSGVMNPDLHFDPDGPKNLILIFLFAIIAALVSALFSVSVSRAEKFAEGKIKNDYIRIFVLGLTVVGLTFLSGNQNYNGTGASIIVSALDDNGAGLPWFAFLLKILFTAITLAAGFKGGEIVPALFIGATLGNAYSMLTGLNPGMCAAIGMGSMFCGITNCPVAALLISFELFGFSGVPYFMIAIPITYLFSGNYGVYKGQKIVYSKFHPEKIDENVHD